MEEYKVKLKLITPMLGTVPKSKEIYAKFIASKAASLELAEEEVTTVQELNERGWTGYHMDGDQPFLYDYALKGFLCESARTLKVHGLVKQLQDKFKRYVFVTPRRILLPKQKKWEYLERPLRAQTAMGPRVTLARSDVIPEGTEISFGLTVLKNSSITEACIKEVLDYGQYMGLLQWRSGGFGRFEVVKFEEV